MPAPDFSRGQRWWILLDRCRFSVPGVLDDDAPRRLKASPPVIERMEEMKIDSCDIAHVSRVTEGETAPAREQRYAHAAFSALRERLWSPAAYRERGCTCAETDIGVGNIHEPHCGEPSPDEIEHRFTEAFLAMLVHAREDEGW